MNGFDNATWQALGLVLTLLGLVVSVIIWSRRGAASGLRAVAWSLLPLAAGLTGVLRLVWDIADSVGRWAVRLVFSPVVWLGVVVAGVSVLLFVVSGFLGRRASRRTAPAVSTSRRRRPAPVTSGPPRAEQSTSPTGKPGRTDGLEGMEDIEEILRKHGIR